MHSLLHAVMERVFKSRPVWLVPVPAGPLAGIKLELDMQWERQFLVEGFERHVVETLQGLVYDGLVCFDIGAHVGFYTLVLARAVAPHGRVFAFEPNPLITVRLERNLERNAQQVATPMTVMQVAIADKNEQRRFFQGTGTSTGRLTKFPPGRSEAEYFNVECVTLDSLVYDRRLPEPDLLKIDVEHAEDQVIRGMTRLLRDHPPTILCEVHDALEGQDLFSALYGAGYSLQSLMDGRHWTSRADVTRGHVLALPSIVA
jgi:FkbM family methyltransferase